VIVRRCHTVEVVPSFAGLMLAGMLLMCGHAKADTEVSKTRVGIVSTPLLFTRSYGPFSVERGGAGVFVATSDDDVTGALEVSVYGSNSPIKTFSANVKLALFVSMGFISIDSSTTLGPEAGVQFTLPLNESLARTTRIVVGVVSHVPLGPGILDIGFRTTPFGTFSGIDSDGTSSKYGLVLRYGFPL